MKLGLQIPSFTWPGGTTAIAATLDLIAERAEASGVYSLWVMDHYFQIQMIGPPEMEMLEGWETLAYLAGKTKKAKLGTLVTGVTYRHPGLLAKIVTTLDVLSGGRSYLGIGAAWNEEEHRGLGVPYAPIAERFERLEETLRIIHAMWADDQTPIQGKWYTLERPLNRPLPIQHPHPPILIGGSGEKKTLRLVAQYADACNLFAHAGPTEVARKLAILKSHCETLERDYAEIEKTGTSSLWLDSTGKVGTQTIDQAVALLGQFADVGIEHMMVSLPHVEEEETFVLLAEVIRQL